jgi:hypothetical protein
VLDAVTAAKPVQEMQFWSLTVPFLLILNYALIVANVKIPVAEMLLVN